MKKFIDHLVPINNHCNQKCNFCSAEYRMLENKPIPLKSIFADILKKGNYIQVSGGEPLLHPKLYDILYFIRKYKEKCFIEFQTNGVFLLKNNNLDKLQKFQVNLYNVNYPCHIEAVNDSIAGVPGSLRPREDAMKEIIKRGLALRVNVIVNKENVEYLPEIVEHVHKKFSGLERIQFSFTKAMGAANKNDEVVPKYEESEEFFIQALALCKKYHIQADVDHIPMCFLGEYYKNHVDYHKMKAGEEGVFLSEKNYVARCEGCDKKSLCTGYRKDYLDVYDI